MEAVKVKIINNQTKGLKMQGKYGKITLRRITKIKRRSENMELVLALIFIFMCAFAIPIWGITFIFKFFGFMINFLAWLFIKIGVRFEEDE